MAHWNDSLLFDGENYIRVQTFHYILCSLVFNIAENWKKTMLNKYNYVYVDLRITFIQGFYIILYKPKLIQI